MARFGQIAKLHKCDTSSHCKLLLDLSLLDNIPRKPWDRFPNPSLQCNNIRDMQRAPQRAFLVWTPDPSGNSNLGPYFPLTILAFKSPLLLGISNDPLHWWYGYLLEPLL